MVLGPTIAEISLWQSLEWHTQFPLALFILFFWVFLQISSEEEANENETEWLMEEVAAPNQRTAKGVQENGHITTKSVTSGAFTSLHVDDLDSEDEVLTIPDVKIQTGRGLNKSKHPQKKPPNLGSDDKAYLLNGRKESKAKAKPGQQQAQNSTNTASFHDDSDEDLLNI